MKRVFVLASLTLVLLTFRNSAEWLIVYPADWVLPLKDYLNAFMTWFEQTFGWIFKGITILLEAPLGAVHVAVAAAARPSGLAHHSHPGASSRSRPGARSTISSAKSRKR